MVTGTVLSGRYRIEERLAVGGMGAVYVANDERLGRRVALKVLKEELAHDPRFVERFRREARAAGGLSHPNVAGVYDFGEHGERYYMVMELAQGRDLARTLREQGPLSSERAARIASQIARALAHAHAAGVVHRDVKPANVIVDEADRVKVTDFGIARAAGDSTLTATGSVLGTAHYLSPEQAGGSEVGPASDIYSLGIVLYEMLTGSLPFTGDSAVAVAMRHISDDVPPPSALVAGIPGGLDDVVARATAKEPGARFAGTAAMAEAIESAMRPTAEAAGPAAMAGAETEVMDQTVWPIPGTRWDPQRLGRMVLIGFAVLALIAFSLLLLRLRDAGDKQPSRATERQPSQEVETQEPQEGFVILDEIIGADYEEILPELEAAGLEVNTEEADSEEPAGTILETDPAVGERVAEGDTITLVVSTGEVDEDDDEEAEHGNPDKPDKSQGKGHDKEEDD